MTSKEPEEEDVAKEDQDALKALPGMTNDMLRIIRKCSRGDRYLGMTAAMTQVPVPTALNFIFLQ